MSDLVRALEALLHRIEASEARSQSTLSRMSGAMEVLANRVGGVEAGAFGRGHTSAVGISPAELEHQGGFTARGATVEQPSEKLELALTGLAEQVSTGEDRMRSLLDELRGQVSALTHRVAGLALERSTESARVEDVASRILWRIEEVEAATETAVAALRSGFDCLGVRLETLERGSEERYEAFAAELEAKIASASESATARAVDYVDERSAELDSSLKALGRQVAEAEKRHASAIAFMGRDVLRLAESLQAKVSHIESESEQRLGAVSEEMSELRGVVEQHRAQVESVGLAALERLGSEIERVEFRLAARVEAADQRTVDALDAVGRSIESVTGALEKRVDHLSEDLRRRVLESERRTAAVLEQSRAKLDERLRSAHRRATRYARYVETRLDAAGAQEAAKSPELAQDLMQSRHDETAPSTDAPLDHFGPDYGPVGPLFDIGHGAPISVEDRSSHTDVALTSPSADGGQDGDPFSIPVAAPSLAASEPRPATKFIWSPFQRHQKEPKGARLLSTLVVVGSIAAVTLGASAGFAMRSGEDGEGEGEQQSSARPPATKPASLDALERRIALGDLNAKDELFTRAEQGEAAAQRNLARLYAEGLHGFDKDPFLARHWADKAVINGDLEAMIVLGDLWSHGRGGPMDEAVAISFYERAANGGLSSAQLKLARVYDTADSEHSNSLLAYRWYRAALDNGEQRAKEGVERLGAFLDFEQRAYVNRLLSSSGQRAGQDGG